MRISDWSSDVCSSDLTAVRSGAAGEIDDTLVRGRDYSGCRGHAGDREGADRRAIGSGRGGATPLGRRRMSARDGLIIALPENEGGEPLWTRIVDGAVVQAGAGINWLAACGLAALPKDCVVMLVPPASLPVLRWISYPSLPVRQGRAAGGLGAVGGGVASADSPRPEGRGVGKRGVGTGESWGAPYA